LATKRFVTKQQKYHRSLFDQTKQMVDRGKAQAEMALEIPLCVNIRKAALPVRRQRRVNLAAVVLLFAGRWIIRLPLPLQPQLNWVFY
jgi:hypothetical protein